MCVFLRLRLRCCCCCCLDDADDKKEFFMTQHRGCLVNKVHAKWKWYVRFIQFRHVFSLVLHFMIIIFQLSTSMLCHLSQFQLANKYLITRVKHASVCPCSARSEPDELPNVAGRTSNMSPSLITFSIAFFFIVRLFRHKFSVREMPVA